MQYGKMRLFWLPLICACWLITGGINPVGAVAEESKTGSNPALVEGEIRLEDQEKVGKPEGEGTEDECPTTFGPIITDTAVPIEKGKFAIQPTFSLGFITDSLTQSWRRVSAGGNYSSFGMGWKFTYGLWDNLETFVVATYIHNWASDVNEAGPGGERSADFGGLGDINLTFKYCLVEETETRPTVSALFFTDFPVGHYKHLNPRYLGTDAIGGGAYAFTGGLNLSKYVRPFVLYGNLWYSVSTAFTDDETRVYPRDKVTLNLAGEYPLTKKWVALLELTSYWDTGRMIGHKANTPASCLVSVMPGIEYMATEKFSMALGLNVDLIGKNSETSIIPMLSMVYAF
ncbi:transporter [Desulfobacca acetoxidans]